MLGVSRVSKFGKHDQWLYCTFKQVGDSARGTGTEEPRRARIIKTGAELGGTAGGVYLDNCGRPSKPQRRL